MAQRIGSTNSGGNYARSDMLVNGVTESSLDILSAHGADATLVNFKDPSWFASNLSSWDFTNVWTWPANDTGPTKGLPVLRKSALAPTYYNEAKSGTFTKNDCGTGNTGSSGMTTAAQPAPPLPK